MQSLEFYLDALSQDDLIYFFLPIFVLSLVAEYWFDRKNRLGLFEIKDTKASLWMMLMVGVVDVLPKLAAIVAFYMLHEISPLADVIQRQWWAWVLLFFLDDITYYFFHRSNHEVRLLPLPLLGFDPLMIFTMMSLNLFYQFWLHTELISRLPNLVEYFFNTPSHHRVHHASNIRYLDCNHAGVLIIWDRLFGTFSEQSEDEEPIYGLTTNITSYAPLDVALHEYHAILVDVKRASRWRDKLGYLIMAPGWSHDGPDKRAKTLRSQIL